MANHNYFSSEKRFWVDLESFIGKKMVKNTFEVKNLGF